MFNKILIANRGEIACRVIKTARRMGIATVAVYSDADANARHVRLADEAVHIGPAPARESYLVGAGIIAAAKATGAQAIHPGYGFLSENDAFAEQCAAEGIVFIGPPAAAIRAMGSKSAAKTLMAKAGVPLTPGYHGDDQDPALLAREAGKIGFPVLIKASAGGGGKGMRRVDKGEDFAAALASCRREAKSAFGDDRVLVEQYVLKPRHIEIQVFADSLGHCVYLFERDCSVQRRHQKVLEEAPAPGMTAERRAAMGQAAVEAAKAVGYVGAGTVEFIAHPDGRFYFMEMNTRLQVEHPVTEMITGLDLVEWQLRVASGEALPRTQASSPSRPRDRGAHLRRGSRQGLPALDRAPGPSRAAGAERSVRVDTGVEQGDAITPFYDPMIAKLIVHGADRAGALAPDEERARAVPHRRRRQQRRVPRPPGRERLVRACRSRHGADRTRAGGAVSGPGAAARGRLAARRARRGRARCGAARRAADRAVDPGSPWRALDGWRTERQALRRLGFRHGETMREVDVGALPGGAWQVSLDGVTVTATAALGRDGT